MLCGLAFPFSVSQVHPLFAFRAPSIWMRVVGILGGPDETDALLSDQTSNDVLTDERLSGLTMRFAVNAARAIVIASIAFRRSKKIAEEVREAAARHRISLAT